MGRAYSASQVQSIKHDKILFTGDWEKAFGQPESRGTWLIWGHSGNGKSSFMMQLAKELCKFGKVAYNSLEEGIGLSFKNSLIRHRMEEVDGRFFILNSEPMDELSERLSKRKSPDFIIIDSLQYTGMNYARYKALKEKHPTKLFIYVSHASGQNPEGRVANKMLFDANTKIFVEGYMAECKGRFRSDVGFKYTIWEEGASLYWLKSKV